MAATAPMLRACLLVYPSLAIYVLLGGLLFVPLTWIIRDIRPIYWVARTGVRLALFLSGVKVDWVGLDLAWKPKTAIYVSNHISNIDPPALFGGLPRIAVILKKELRKIPLLGYIMGMGGFIYVDRKARNSRKHALEAGVATLRDGISLLIFPEGTRSKTDEMLPFRPGPFTMAIEAGAPLVPITVHGTRELMPKGTLAIRPGRIRIICREPIATEGLRATDRPALMDRVRAIMQQDLDAHAKTGSSSLE